MTLAAVDVSAGFTGKPVLWDVTLDVSPGETVGLGDEIHQNALSLSAGEAQRVAFARALAVDPDVMLLDEPTSSLDALELGPGTR